MAEPEVLSSRFAGASGASLDHVKAELAHRHMIALADTFGGWANYPGTSAERSAQLLGWSEALETLARRVGPGHNPPEPDTVTLFGFLARKALSEASPPRRV